MGPTCGTGTAALRHCGTAALSLLPLLPTVAVLHVPSVLDWGPLKHPLDFDSATGRREKEGGTVGSSEGLESRRSKGGALDVEDAER